MNFDTFLLQLSISLNVSEAQHQMATVLHEAIDTVHCKLQRALQDWPGHCTPCGQQEDDRMMFLLQKYSEELVQMTQNKLNRM